MNNNWKLNLLAIAAFSAAAVTASAQQISLAATVPFEFSVNGSTHLAPGKYVVSRKGDTWWFRSYDENQVAATVGYARIEGKADEQPRLTFACLRGQCDIRAIHAGGGYSGAQMPERKLSKSDKQELSLVNVPLRPSNSQDSTR